GTTFDNDFRRIIQPVYELSFYPKAKCFFVLFSSCDSGLFSLENERFDLALWNQVVDTGIQAGNGVALFMPAHAGIASNDGISGKYASTKPAEMKIRCDPIVRTPLISPFRVGDDGVVVIDELPSKPQTDPPFLGIARFQIRQFQVPRVLIGWSVWRLLKKRPGILDLRNHSQPGRRSKIHLITKAGQNITVVLSSGTTSALVAFESKAVFSFKPDPRRQFPVQEADRPEVANGIWRGRRECSVCRTV